MKYVNRVKIITALLAAVAVLNSGQLVAQESGFNLEESLHQQVFHELRQNVEHLYQSTRLLKTETDDGDIIARTAQTGFALPAIDSRSGAARNSVVNTVN
jgi:ABC-type arginine transport system ATPase subunit